MIGSGLQLKTADELAAELELPASQLLGLFNKTIRKISQYFTSVVEKELGAELESSINKNAATLSPPVPQTLNDELNEEAQVSSAISFLLNYRRSLLSFCFTENEVARREERKTE